jgi:hypothetical protein
MENNIAIARMCRGRFFARACPICGHIIDLGQPIPQECTIESLTIPFRNAEGWVEFSRSGVCQDCQDNRYGKVD